MANPEHERIFRSAERERDVSIILRGFDLRKMIASCARLNGINLSGADLRDSDLSGAHLQGANLSGANLSRVRVTLGDFRDANLSNADLTGANLTGSVMVGADLSNANLTKASLVKTRLNGVKLNGANLDRVDLRGAQGITGDQLGAANNSERAILDVSLLSSLGRTGDTEIARHGMPKRQRKPTTNSSIDFLFDKVKPCFGGVFLLCGYEHPEFPPTGEYGFANLQDLGIEQVDDYFGICVKGDAVIWVFPLIRDRIVEHHSGPFDGIRIELGSARAKSMWTNCVSRFADALTIPFTQKQRG